MVRAGVAGPLNAVLVVPETEKTATLTIACSGWLRIGLAVTCWLRTAVPHHHGPFAAAQNLLAAGHGSDGAVARRVRFADDVWVLGGVD